MDIKTLALLAHASPLLQADTSLEIPPLRFDYKLDQHKEPAAPRYLHVSKRHEFRDGKIFEQTKGTTAKLRDDARDPMEKLNLSARQIKKLRKKIARRLKELGVQPGQDAEILGARADQVILDGIEE